MTTRREFLARCASVAGTALLPRTAFALTPRSTSACEHMAHAARMQHAHGHATLGPHPTPRPGITSAKMLASADMKSHEKAIPVFDAVRAIPEVVDGIRCNCGCASTQGFYSLLSCYEGPHAMALDCSICQGQGRLAARLHKEGRTLDEIRAAVDAKFG